MIAANAKSRVTVAGLMLILPRPSPGWLMAPTQPSEPVGRWSAMAACEAILRFGTMNCSQRQYHYAYGQVDDHHRHKANADRSCRMANNSSPIHRSVSDVLEERMPHNMPSDDLTSVLSGRECFHRRLRSLANVLLIRVTMLSHWCFDHRLINQYTVYRRALSIYFNSSF